MKDKSCAFCQLPASRVVAGDDLAVVIRDGFPVSQGHTLVIPRRHIRTFFELTTEERATIFALLDSAKTRIETEFHPDGYNIGVNEGPAAGQTVAHLHIHLIPRYSGDSPDPRGGVRWVLPKMADYWSRK